MRHPLTLLALLVSLPLSASASAADLAGPEDLAPSPSISAAPSKYRPNLRTDFTAYTRPGGRVSMGPLKFEFGPIDEVTIGTYVPPWFAFPFIGAPVPNAYIKVRSWFPGPFTLAVRGGLLFVDGKAVAELADKDASASAMGLAGEVDASYRFGDHFTLSAGLDYNHLSAVGSDDQVSTSVEGASTADTWNSRLFAEWKLTKVFSLTFLVRYLISQSPISAEANTNSPAFSVNSDLSTESTGARGRWSAAPGVSFDWEHWELSIGVGYGVVPLPVFGIPTTKNWPLVDFAFAFHFDLYD